MVLVAPQATALPRIFVATHEYLPYLVITPALILCFAFRLPREFNLLVILLLIHWALFHYVWHPGKGVNINKPLLLDLVALLLPLNLLANNLLKDRGIISRHGLTRLAATLLQISLIAFLLWLNPKGAHQALNITLFQTPGLKGLSMPQLSLLGFIAAGLLIVVRAVFRTSSLNLNQIALAFSCALVIAFARNDLFGSLFLTLAATTILIGILLNSYILAYLDELTGLPTRRALKQQLTGLGNRYSVAMLDIDHFKKLNDTYGHDVGDQILKMVASRIRRVPGASKTFRYGGEEFTVLFPNKSLNEAHLHAKEICKAIAKSPFVLRNQGRGKKRPPLIVPGRIQNKIDVTISIGVAQKTGHHETAHDAIKAADRALYRAKETGRNRACI